MKKLILLFILFPLFAFSQNSLIEFTTDYKNSPSFKFNNENYNFKIIDNKKIIVNDLDLKIVTEYFVNFMDSSYTKGNEFFMISYTTDFEKTNKIASTKISNFEPKFFILIYDKKNGNILAIKIYNQVDGKFQNPQIYLTELGRKKMKFEDE